MSVAIASVIAIAASAGAGLIHLALAPAHVDELGPLGWGFYVAAALQVGWAALVLALLGRSARNPASGRDDPADAASDRVRWLAIAGIGINVAILGAWGVSRTVGLPAGDMPWQPEPIGRADAIAAALEVALIAALLLAAALRPAAARQRARRGTGLRRAHLAGAMAVVVISAGSAVGIAPDARHAAAHGAADGATTNAAMTDAAPTPATTR